MRLTFSILSALLSLSTFFHAVPVFSLNGTASFSDRPGMTACDGPLRRSCDPAVQRLAFENFLNTFYVQRNITRAFLTYVHPSLIQHNPFLPDGRDASLRALTAAPTPSSGGYTLLRHGLSNGTGWLHSRATNPGMPATALADFWRLEGPCIMEQ